MSLLPDLTSARTAAEAILTDRCRITRDAEGTSDDVLDRTTNKLAPPSPDTTTVYEGPCLISSAILRETESVEGGRPVYRRRRRARVPMSAPLARAEDRLEVLSSESDPAMVGKRYKVIDAGVNSIGVTRVLIIEDDQGVTVRT